jgi:peroxiredoxin
MLIVVTVRGDGFHSPLLFRAMLSPTWAPPGFGASMRKKVARLTSPPWFPADASNEAENRHPTLNAGLAAYRQDSARLRPAFAKAYDELVARLDGLDRGEVGPQVGEPLPAFNLPDENGNLVSLSSLLRLGPAVISFNRGHWCPYCKMDLRSLAATHGEIRALGANVVSIMPDTAQFTRGFANDLPFPVLSDIDLGYSLSLGLIFWVGAEIARMYREVGVELEKYHGNRGSFLPMAAKFVVGQDGLIRARQVNIEFRERMEPETLLAALRGLPGG